MMTQVLFSIFFSKKIRTLTPLSRLHLTGPIHRVEGGGGGRRDDRLLGETGPVLSLKTKTFEEKEFVNFLCSLTMFSITFMLYNNSTQFSNCFCFCEYINN